MMPPKAGYILAFVTPLILLAFSSFFLWVQTLNRNTWSSLALACGFFLYAVGMALHLPRWPQVLAPAIVISAVFYTAGCLALAEGILLRARQRFPRPVGLLLVILVPGAMYYYGYVEDSLAYRVCILNTALSFIFMVTTCKIWALRQGRPADRVLLCLLVLLSVHFVPRIIVTLMLAPWAENVPANLPIMVDAVFWITLQPFVGLTGAMLALSLLANAILDMRDELTAGQDMDPLTRLLNRRGFERKAASHFKPAARRPVSLILCDIDHFKSINDTFGHPAGDRVLAEFGALLRNSLRDTDILARVGGEEFIIMLPDEHREAALQVAERTRRHIEWSRPGDLPIGWRITASFGVVARLPGESWPELYARVDRLLYLAKQRGRNCCVTLHDQEQEQAPLPTLMQA
ncbi:MAG: hypothetical protein JWP20_1140 [Roseomonas sp.]|jgi:diguanylate cyclase (GGDEF)-like protein|nr:hypothetical protein [Roseomonas sp.]